MYKSGSDAARASRIMIADRPRAQAVRMSPASIVPATRSGHVFEIMDFGSPIRCAQIFEIREDSCEALHVVRYRTQAGDGQAFVNFGGRDAYAATLLLEDVPQSFFIRNGRTEIRPPRRARHTSLYDLGQSLHWRADHVLDALSFVLPRSALERWARDAGLRTFEGVLRETDQPLPDEVILGFGQALLPLLDQPDKAPRLFVDYVLHAVCGYVVRTFGVHDQPAVHKGGLAAWQERRAKEMIVAHLDDQLSLQDLATECRLSVSHFTKAFRQSLGQTPHQWLLERRVEHARTLMATTRLSLSEVAITCGFADQSHFTRAFAKRAGSPPAVWRREHAGAARREAMALAG